MKFNPLIASAGLAAMVIAGGATAALALSAPQPATESSSADPVPTNPVPTEPVPAQGAHEVPDADIPSGAPGYREIPDPNDEENLQGENGRPIPDPTAFPAGATGDVADGTGSCRLHISTPRVRATDNSDTGKSVFAKAQRVGCGDQQRKWLMATVMRDDSVTPGDASCVGTSFQVPGHQPADDVECPVEKGKTYRIVVKSSAGNIAISAPIRG